MYKLLVIYYYSYSVLILSFNVMPKSVSAALMATAVDSAAKRHKIWPQGEGGLASMTTSLCRARCH